MSEPYTVVPLTPLRKAIARRMSDAKQTIPHFRVVTDIELDALLLLRERNNSDPSSFKISINDCLVKACAQALMEHPGINIQIVEQEVHRYTDCDISVIVSVEGGLAAPVVRQANRKSVQEISREIQTLVSRAAAKQLRMDEVLGGSFSISNLGAFEVDQFDAIINPPQCAILAVGRARPRPVCSDAGELRAATVLKATLSVDHRAIDGAEAAAFMSTLRKTIERPHGVFSN